MIIILICNNININEILILMCNINIISNENKW